MSSSTLVTYYIQGELGESLELPNGFMMRTSPSSQVTFGQFLKEFPLPNHADFHFRFRMDDKQCDYSWLDVKYSQDILPTYRNGISAKLLRLGDAVAMQRRSRLKLKASVTTAGAGKSPSVPSSSRNHQPSSLTQPSTSPSLTESDFNTSVSNTATAAASAEPIDMFFDDSPVAPSPAAPVAVAAPTSTRFKTVNPYLATDDDIDEDPAPTSSNVSSNQNTDLFGLSETSDSKPIPVDGDRGSGSAAVEAMRSLDAQKKKEDEDMDQSRQKLETKVNNYIFSNGEKRNVRALLTSMHTVVNWPNNGWKVVNLSDVIEAKRVKLYYRKAMMVVHPDKATKFDADAKYICRRVFEAVNDAYKEFEKKELV